MQDNEIFWTKFKTPLGLIVGMGTNTKLQSLKFAKNTIFEKSISNYKKNKVFIDIPMKNKNNKTSKINIKANNDNEYLLYSSEESNEEDNNNQTSF